MGIAEYRRELVTTALLAGVCVAALGCGAPGSARVASSFEDLEGGLHDPLLPGEAKANVLLFAMTDCPISNGYAPKVNALAEEFQPQGFRFYLVHVDPETGVREASAHAVEYGYTLPILLDPEHFLVAAVGATVTPEVAVIGPGGELLYRGRIDDWYAELGKKRRAPTTHDLRLVLETLAAGRPVAASQTQAVGCFIPDLD